MAHDSWDTYLEAFFCFYIYLSKGLPLLLIEFVVSASKTSENFEFIVY